MNKGKIIVNKYDDVPELKYQKSSFNKLGKNKIYNFDSNFLSKM